MYSWKFDSIDFDDYGVRIRSTSGILNLPKLQNEGYDWLDEHGREYWQLATDRKYADREITLNCYIRAGEGEETSAYDEFITKIAAFYAAITSAGTHTLTTPYGNISNVTLQAGVDMSQKYKYVKSLQVGLFALRLVVAGDDPLQYFNINHASGSPVVAVIGTRNMQVHRVLQGDSYASCTTEANDPITANMYDYVWINTNGVNNEPYYLMQKPELKKVSGNKYVYDLRFEHGSTLLKNSLFLVLGEADFYLYDDLDGIIDLVVTNAERFIPGKFVKGTIATTINKNHKFSGENCYDVIRRLAEEYELEFDIQFVGGSSPYYTINIVEQIADTKSISLEYGKGKGLYELVREPVNRDNLCTVLYAYGAAKNLKPEYRLGKTRLEFDGNPLKENDDLYMNVERHKFFDDIYPQRTAAVSAYYQVLPDDLTDAQREVYPGGIYRITDSTLDFDLNDYLLGGLTAKVRMKTGDLAGMEFEIERYDNNNKYIFIIPFKDERGQQYPETLLIQAGDDYTLVDIDQPTTYVDQAEAELKAAAADYLEKYSTPEYPYRCIVQPVFHRSLSGGKFAVGDRITVVDSDFGINGLYRISAFVYNAYKETYELTLSEHRILTKREVVNQRLNDIQRSIKTTKKDKVESMRKEQETATELRNRIFDPSDDRQDLDRTVRNESIDPRMLGFDSGVPQYSITGLLVETNYLGVQDDVRVTAGTVIVSNWPDATKERYDIAKDRANYNPTRIWTVAETIFNLPDTDGYFLYVKIPTDDLVTTGTLEVAKPHVEAKRYIEDGYIYYKLGYINEPASPRVACMLWGNTKPSGSSALSEISFEYCIQSGVAQEFVIDLYVTSGYTIEKAILESDGTLEGVAVEIDSVTVTGLADMDVSTVQVFTASALNSASAGSRVTITTTGDDTGTPTVLRGKIVLGNYHEYVS